VLHKLLTFKKPEIWGRFSTARRYTNLHIVITSHNQHTVTKITRCPQMCQTCFDIILSQLPFCITWKYYKIR